MESSGKYNLIRFLDRGRFGPVSLVQCTSSMKKFVLKEIHLQNASEQEQKTAFLEASLLTTLRHPNIVSYVEAYRQSNGCLYVLTCYCEGGHLSGIIQQRNDRAFRQSQIVDWLIQICLALKHLHSNKILHRDLKTRNIFLAHSGILKLGELGITHAFEKKHDVPNGVSSYISPEKLANKPYSCKTDVWCLGCSIFEIASLKQTFDPLDLFSSLQNMSSKQTLVFPKSYSTDFVRLLSSMLTHDPKERPAVEDILLNTYVRTHITEYLDKNKTRVHRSRSRSKMTNRGNKKTDKIIASSPDQCIADYLLSNEKKIEQREDNVIKNVTSAITIPDINGNGDGNDNSQHAQFLSMQKTSVLSKSAEEEANNCATPRDSVDSAASSRNCSHGSDHSRDSNCSKRGRPHLHSCPSSLAQSSCPSNRTTPRVFSKTPCSTSSSSKSLKNKGEISLDFLKNLSEAMNRVRNSRSSCTTPGFEKPTSFCISSPSLPNLNDTCCLCNMTLVDRNSCFYCDNTRLKTACHCGTMPSIIGKTLVTYHRPNCTNHRGENRLPPLSAPSNMNAMLPEMVEILFSKNSIAATKDDNIDKRLLRDIVTSNKNGLTNLAARQRRREKMLQFSSNAMTKSAPASVETFPAV